MKATCSKRLQSLAGVDFIFVLSYQFFLHKPSNQPMLSNIKLMVLFRELPHDARQHGETVCKYLIRKGKQIWHENVYKLMRFHYPIEIFIIQRGMSHNINICGTTPNPFPSVSVLTEPADPACEQLIDRSQCIFQGIYWVLWSALPLNSTQKGKYGSMLKMFVHTLCPLFADWKRGQGSG